MVLSLELQDEYEELLRYAVVAPKLDTLPGTKPKTSQSRDEARLQQPPDAATEASARVSTSRNVGPSQVSPVISEPSTHSRISHVERSAGQPLSRASEVSDSGSDRLQALSERCGTDSPVPSEFPEMFITEENISKMEDMLDTWSNNLKMNVLTELRKWKFAIMDQHKIEMMKEKEKHATEIASVKSEINSLKELVRTYETSNQRKDEVIVNLSKVLDKQKEKVEKMRTLTSWRLKHAEAKEEAQQQKVAQQHYNLQLKRKVWFGWHSVVKKHWKTQMEKACRLRAEEVCARMSAEYEAKLTEHCLAVEKAEAEICRLRAEREQYEESMKKAFMRGVCALNMEALSMFHPTEGRQEQPHPQAQHGSLPPREEQRPAQLSHFQTYPSCSSRFSPLHFDRTQSELGDMFSSRAPMSQDDASQPINAAHGSVPPGGIPSAHRQTSGRTMPSSNQRAGKTVTARISARAETCKGTRSNLQVMGVNPPMASVIVERHHPISQATLGQATAARYPRSSQQTSATATGRGPPRTPSGSCHVHSIKVVE